MIGGHPEGLRLTKRLLALAEGLKKGRALDLGAGDGGTARYLRNMGWTAEAVDLWPAGDGVRKGDMRSLPFADGSFELCLAECSLAVCGDGPGALREACRVLKPSGMLLVSDVFFSRPEAPSLSMGGPLTCRRWEEAFRKAGFLLTKWEDASALWREFFLESLWNGNADEACADFFRRAGKAGCGYFLARLEKGEKDGSI